MHKDTHFFTLPAHESVERHLSELVGCELHIEDEIGSGGYGIVYGLRTTDNARFAVKICESDHRRRTIPTQGK